MAIRQLKIFILIVWLIIQTTAQAQPCTGTPASNTVVTSSAYFCPGQTLTLSLANAYAQSGLNYQWVYSTATSFGPWTTISGATSSVLVTGTLPGSAYYAVSVECPAALASITTSPVYVNVGVAGVNTVAPFTEQFIVPANDVLPNCSWSVTSPGVVCRTFSATANAGFSFQPLSPGTESFYSMGLQLNSGVAYNYFVSYQHTAVSSANNWSGFSISLVPAQGPANATLLATSPGTVVPFSGALSSTFSVVQSGIYYLQISATSVAGSTVAPVLYFDNLQVYANCNNAPNIANYSVSPTPTGCIGSTVVFTVNLAPNCVLPAHNGNTISLATSTTPLGSYSVLVTNTMSGCTLVKNQNIIMSPRAQLYCSPLNATICGGGSATVLVSGNFNNFTVFPSGTIYSGQQVLSLNPIANTIYSIIANSNAGCTSSVASISIAVSPQPTLQLSPSSATICNGDAFTFTATGAKYYFVGNYVYLGVITVYNQASTKTIQVTGKNEYNCTATSSFTLNANECTGFEENTQAIPIYVFPQPAAGNMHISCDDAVNFRLYDCAGKEILCHPAESTTSVIDITKIPGGVYILEVQRVYGMSREKVIIQHQD